MKEDNFIRQIKPDEEKAVPAKISEEKRILDPIKPIDPNLKSKTVQSSNGGKSTKKRKYLKLLTLFLILFFTFAAIFLNIYLKGRKVLTNAYKLQESVKLGEIELMRNELGNFRSSLLSFQSAYKFIAWTKFIPFIGGYIGDGQHLINASVIGADLGQITLETIEPYSDLIGLKGGQENVDGGKTAADRIDFIVKAIPSLLPKMDEISTKATLVKQEVDQVNPTRYPKKFAGKLVRERIENAIDLVDETTKLITNGKPLLQAAPYILGLDSSRTYLILFQNDKELRPTGGFMTAYSIMNVDKGKFEPVSSNDIYNLDARYKPDIAAPEAIIKYIKGPYILSKNIRLRDMNWSPDFYESMELFTTEAKSIGLEGIDGVIAVDTQVLVYLLDVLGPVGVSGFGNFSTKIIPECNCPQVIYELESFADVEGPIVWDPVSGEIVYSPPNSDNRKRIIGPLMNSIMSNALGQPKEKIPALAEAAFKSLIEKHVLLYLYDKDAQKAVESFGIAGRVSNVEADYLLINDANLGGRKSNLYVTQEVNEEITIAKDGSVEKLVTVTYNNPEKHDGWLNSVLPNWVRIYVPKGSQLITFDGVEDQQTPYEESDKTVFAGFFELRPQGLAKVTVKYKLPFKVKDVYKYFIQKQPGKDAPLYSIKIGKTEEEFLLKEDKELKIRI
jgi:hypothetical protein